MNKLKPPIKVGLIGTGYAGQRRAEALQSDDRAQLLYLTGHTPATVQAMATTYQAKAINSWQDLVKFPELDLVIITTINSEHGSIVQAALEAGKHVITEYPLTLNFDQAKTLLHLAQTQEKLLHVEHIELLGGVHQAIKENLSQIGEVSYARYLTIMPQNPAPQKWTYDRDLFGFPFSAALSRLHRFTDLFGPVVSVSSRLRYWDAPGSNYYTACLATAQLQFKSGLIADTTYGKGEVFSYGSRTFEVYGQKGTLILEGETGKLRRGSEISAIEVGDRRGLFNKDTSLVLDYLIEGQPLYVNIEDSYHTLAVAEAARQSAATGQTVQL